MSMSEAIFITLAVLYGGFIIPLYLVLLWHRLTTKRVKETYHTWS